MATALGFVQIGIELGLDAILVKPKRQIAEFTAQVTISEEHVDELEITDQPVEQGAMISDHAFKRPAEVTIRCGWSNSPGSSTLLGSIASAFTGTLGGVSSLLTGNSVSQIKDIYAKFLALQESRIPFDVYTGKRVYTNMLVQSCRTTTDKETENSLFLTVRLRQIIIVRSAVTLSVVSEDAAQEDPGDTSPTVDNGITQLEPAGEYNEDAGDASIGDEGLSA